MTEETVKPGDRPDQNLGFSCRSRKDGQVVIAWNGKSVTILRGSESHTFVGRMKSLDAAGQQQLMARVTGNFKRGNERKASRHQRNR